MLRKGQKELIELYRGGYCGIPAIPGGGKTFALTQWAIKAIEEGVNKPGKILIVTYMNSAVNNFKQRISDALEQKGINSNDYFVSTIHSLCLQILKENPDKALLDEDFTIIDTGVKNQLLRSATSAWKRQGNNKKLYEYFLDENIVKNKGYEKISGEWEKCFLGLSADAISSFKTEGISSKEALEKTKKFNTTSLLRISAEIYINYEFELQKRGYIDFEDMLLKAKNTLTFEPQILEKFKKKYSFICEDEAQDSNKIQTEILSLIAGEKGNFLRVGDSNQAILTTFSGSDMELFKNFCNDKKTTIYNIVQSSRSAIQIINLANKFVSYVNTSHPQEEAKNALLPQFIEPVDKDDEYPNPVVTGQAIFVSSFKKKDDEYSAIASKCQEIVMENKDKTLAVLLPSRYKISEFVKVLNSQKIKYECLDNYSGERNSTLVMLGRVLDFVASPEDNKKIIEIIKLLIPEDTTGLEELLIYLENVEIEELLYPSFKDDIVLPTNTLKTTLAFKKFIEIKKMLIDFLEFPFTLIEKLVIHIAQKLNFSKEEMAIAQKVASSVRFLVAEEPRYKVSDLANELLNAQNSFNYFVNLVWELKGYQAKPGVVCVSTYHKSKGLEWDIVFLGSINSDDFPTKVTDKFRDEVAYLKPACSSPTILIKEEMAKLLDEKKETDYRKKARIDIISEKTRLLYVGITRAKKLLYCSAVKNSRLRPSEYFNYIEETTKSS